MFSPNKAVKRTNHFNFKPCGFFKHRLNLSTVFSDNVCVIPSCLVHILGVKIDLVGKNCAVKCAECTESVGRKQSFCCYVVGHHNFGPMHHRRHNKSKLMTAEF